MKIVSSFDTEIQSIPKVKVLLASQIYRKFQKNAEYAFHQLDYALFWFRRFCVI